MLKTFSFLYFRESIGKMWKEWRKILIFALLLTDPTVVEGSCVIKDQGRIIECRGRFKLDQKWIREQKNFDPETVETLNIEDTARICLFHDPLKLDILPGLNRVRIPACDCVCLHSNPDLEYSGCIPSAPQNKCRE